MPLDLLFIGQDGRSATSCRASRFRRPSSRRASRSASCSNSRPARPKGRHQGRRPASPSGDQRSCRRRAMPRGDGFDPEGNCRRDAVLLRTKISIWPSSTRQPARRRRAGAPHPRICLDPYGQLGFARLGEDAQRCRLPRDRLRQSRPWPIVEELRSGRLHAAKDGGRRCGAARPSRNRPRACHGLLDGRADLGFPGACRAQEGRDAGVRRAGHRHGRRRRRLGSDRDACWRTMRRAVTHPRGKIFRAFADQTKSDRKALAACISTSRTLLTEAEVGAHRAADAGRRRHEGRHRRLARRAGAADAQCRELFASRAGTTCWRSATGHSSSA